MLDIARRPHPKALAMFYPLIVGGAFLAGVCYFRPDLIGRAMATVNLDQTIKIGLGLILSYSAGALLITAIVAPFIGLVYVFGMGTMSCILVWRHASTGKPIPASQRPTWRRAVTALFGPAGLPPRSAEDNTQDFVEKITKWIRERYGEQALDLNDRTDQLRTEATKLFTAEHNEQWDTIHSALGILAPLLKNRTMSTLEGLELPSALAAAIVVWTWLSYPVPPLVYSASKVVFAFLGVITLFQAMSDTVDIYVGRSMEAWLLQQHLKKHQ
jgi:hypothetical protein